jgi:hypothetical protein
MNDHIRPGDLAWTAWRRSEQNTAQYIPGSGIALLLPQVDEERPQRPPGRHRVLAGFGRGARAGS